jgi:hypothetical protein
VLRENVSLDAVTKAFKLSTATVVKSLQFVRCPQHCGLKGRRVETRPIRITPREAMCSFEKDQAVTAAAHARMTGTRIQPA